MKKILLIILCIFGLNLNTLCCSGEQNSYDGLYIQKGTFIKTIPPVEISSATYDIGDKVVFINTSDMYLENINAIPRGSRLDGIIEDIREPVQGTNAAMKIKIHTITTPDKRIMKADAYVFGDESNYIGGELTPAAYYHKMPHYTQGYKGGTLQFTPSNVRELGVAKVLKAGNEVLIILNDDLKL